MTNFFGGSIRVESEVGQGSTFILHFPRKQNTTAPTATAPQLAKELSTEVIL
jgi:hypothetical protein